MSERYPPISQEQLKDLFVIDAKAGQVFWRNVAKEHARLNGTEAGSLRGNSKPYWIIKVGGRAYRRSQIVLAFVTGKWPDQCVDHINGNSLDDRGENLRHASIAENARNHKGRAKKQDTPMGVRKCPNGRFQARIAFERKTRHLGVFPTVDQANAAYMAARKELFGEYA